MITLTILWNGVLLLVQLAKFSPTRKRDAPRAMPLSPTIFFKLEASSFICCCYSSSCCGGTCLCSYGWWAWTESLSSSLPHNCCTKTISHSHLTVAGTPQATALPGGESLRCAQARCVITAFSAFFARNLYCQINILSKLNCPLAPPAQTMRACMFTVACMFILCSLMLCMCTQAEGVCECVNSSLAGIQGSCAHGCLQSTQTVVMPTQGLGAQRRAFLE